MPVELRVAAILAAMCALLPTPVTTTFPFAPARASRAASKESPSEEAAPWSACDARERARRPTSKEEDALAWDFLKEEGVFT